MRVAVIGSQSIANIDIAKLIPDGTTELIIGGTKSIDRLAEKWADKNVIPKLLIKPRYEIADPNTNFRKNKIIVSLSDLIVAVWDGRSPGTRRTIRYAYKIGKPINIYIVDKIERSKNNVVFLEKENRGNNATDR